MLPHVAGKATSRCATASGRTFASALADAAFLPVLKRSDEPKNAEGNVTCAAIGGYGTPVFPNKNETATEACVVHHGNSCAGLQNNAIETGLMKNCKTQCV